MIYKVGLYYDGHYSVKKVIADSTEKAKEAVKAYGWFNPAAEYRFMSVDEMTKYRVCYSVGPGYADKVETVLGTSPLDALVEFQNDAIDDNPNIMQQVRWVENDEIHMDVTCGERK